MKMMLKKFGLSLLALSPFAVLALWFGWSFGMFPDIGAESGYYGQFNRVKHVLESIPGVVIVDHWQHHDVTLEDFGFTLQVGGSDAVQVQFWENSTQMKERNRTRLMEFILREIDSAKSSEAMADGAPHG